MHTPFPRLWGVCGTDHDPSWGSAVVARAAQHPFVAVRQIRQGTFQALHTLRTVHAGRAQRHNAFILNHTCVDSSY